MNKRTKYTVWAFWDNYHDYESISICTREPTKASCGEEFYHPRGSTLCYFSSEEDKLAFMEKVLSIRPGECKSFEVEVDEI